MHCTALACLFESATMSRTVLREPDAWAIPNGSKLSHVPMNGRKYSAAEKAGHRHQRLYMSRHPTDIPRYLTVWNGFMRGCDDFARDRYAMFRRLGRIEHHTADDDEARPRPSSVDLRNFSGLVAAFYADE